MSDTNGSAPSAGADPTDVGDASDFDPAGLDDDVAESEQLAEQQVEHDIEVLLAERDQFKDIALRLQADFENFRKRAERRLTDDVDRATSRFIEDLLPVLDACEAAFSHGVDGIEPIWSALLGPLQRHGLEVMDPLGKPFDPTEHEAVLHEPGEGGDPEVVEVLRTGYRWKGKVLRAAMTKVKG
jgi:molecular chaperone GrpE